MVFLTIYSPLEYSLKFFDLPQKFQNPDPKTTWILALFIKGLDNITKIK